MSKKKTPRSGQPDLTVKKTTDMRETATDWYVILMLLVFPVFCPASLGDVAEPKFFFFASATGLWFLMVLIFSFAVGPPRGFFSPARICALAFVAVCCLSTLVSQYRAEALIGHRYGGLVTQLLLAAIFLGVSQFGHIKERYFLAFGGGITILCLVCVLQKLGLNPLYLYGVGGNYFQYTAFLGTIGNIDTLSALMSLAVPLFLGLSVQREKPYRNIYLVPLFFSALILSGGGAEAGLLGVAVIAVITPVFLIHSMAELRRALACAALALAALALGFSFSGGLVDGAVSLFFRFNAVVAAAVAAAAVCGAAAWLLRFVRAEPSARAFRRAFIILAAAVFIAALLLVYFWPGNSGTLYEASQILHGNFEDDFGSGRGAIWRVTLTNVPDAPLLGGGPGTLYLRNVHVNYETETVARLAHNVYLQYLVDTGLLGLACYLGLLVCAMFVRGRERWKTLDVGLLLGAMAYAVQDFFGLGVTIVSPFFWIFLGLLQTDTPAKPRAKRSSD